MKEKSRYQKNWYDKQFDGNYYVYYLPLHNYCGVTRVLMPRLYNHVAGSGYGNHKYDITGWRILYSSPNQKDAHYHEALFQSVLAMEGLDIRMNKKQKL